MNISEKITLLNQTTLESLKEVDKLRIIEKFTKTALKILKADFGFMFWKQEHNQSYHLIYKSPTTPYQPALPKRRGYNYKASKGRVPYFIKKPRADLLPYMKSIAIIPIFYKNHQYGNIVLGFKKRHNFQIKERALGIAIGNAAAQALTIHNLYFNLKNFKDTLDKTLDSKFIFDPETLKIEYANDGASREFGLSKPELYRRTIVDIQETYKQDLFRELLLPLLKQEEKILTAEGSIKNNRGRNIPIEMSLQFIRTPGQPGKVLTSIQNITERKRIEEKSRQLLKQKDEFLSIASHELKTPITTIKGFTQLLAEGIKKSNKQKYFLGKITSQVDVLTRLVNDLLDVSRIETGKLKFRRKIFELSQLIQDLSADLQISNHRHHIILKLKGKFWIFGDADRISQVLINLITNAIKYSPKARKIIVSLKEKNGLAEVGIEDFGMGVDKTKQQKIFERFFQGRHDDESYPGLGLGLYIASNIIKAHKGKIFCRSKKSRGTIFSFTLPYKKCLLSK